MMRDEPSYLARGDFVYREPAPPVFVAAEGCALVDSEGGRYLDAEAANGAAALGYDGTILHDALKALGPMPGLPSFCESSIRVAVAERLGKRFEEATGLRGRVAFDLGGAQGIELAIKIALRSRRARRFVVFEGGYHGRSIFTSQLSASHRYRATSLDLAVPVTRLPYPDCARCRFGREPETCATECVSFVETSMSSEVAGIAAGDASDVCAFIVEPVINVGGMAFPDKRYLEGAVRILRERGALIIVDEVFTGFGRTGRPWGYQHYDFVPDLVVASKALTNGTTPLSCVWGRDPLLSPENFPPGTHSVTFGNNPLAMAIASAVLDRFDAWPEREARVAAIEGALGDMLGRLARESRLIERVDVRGAVGRVLLRQPRAHELRGIALRVGRADPAGGRYGGLLVASTGMAPAVLALHPPLVIGDGDLACLEDLLARTFRAAA
jgi:4-aminobutyrate aminotransferase-like enzyme